MSVCEICSDESKFTINRGADNWGAEREIKLCSVHYEWFAELYIAKD